MGGRRWEKVSDFGGRLMFISLIVFVLSIPICVAQGAPHMALVGLVPFVIGGLIAAIGLQIKN